MSDLLPKEITMYDVPARLSNDEAIGYLQGYNDAVRKLCTTTSTGWQTMESAPKCQEMTVDALYAEWYKDPVEMDFYEWVVEKKCNEGLKIISNTGEGK